MIIDKIFNSLDRGKNDILIEELNGMDILEPTDNFKILKDILDSLNQKWPINQQNFKPWLILAYQKMGGLQKKTCSVHELMTLDNADKICNNLTLVEGSCGEPNFFSQLTNINPENDKIIRLLELVESKLEPGKTIEIVVGADKGREFENKGDLTLFFSPVATSINIDKIINSMETSDLISSYVINCYFPTNQQGDNKRVLDKVLSLTDKFNINFVNKICGSCFRSMYYLVQNATGNFTYEVNPSQGLNKRTDSNEIIKCFKKH